MSKTFIPNNYCLLIYLDETGHECFADANYPIFGIGGCAVLTETCHRLLEQPWNHLKESIFLKKRGPLHAAEALRTATQEQRRALLGFFQHGLFSRFAVVVGVHTELPVTLIPYQIVAGAVTNQISKIAFPYPLDSIAIIFEDSDRGSRLINQYFGNVKASGEQGEIPIHKHRMSKKAGEPGLEVADFVINAAGRHVRHALKTGKREPNDMFFAIFQSVPRLLAHYQEITNVKVEGSSSLPITPVD